MSYRVILLQIQQDIQSLLVCGQVLDALRHEVPGRDRGYILVLGLSASTLSTACRFKGDVNVILRVVCPGFGSGALGRVSDDHTNVCVVGGAKAAEILYVSHYRRS